MHENEIFISLILVTVVIFFVSCANKTEKPLFTQLPATNQVFILVMIFMTMILLIPLSMNLDIWVEVLVSVILIMMD